MGNKELGKEGGYEDINVEVKDHPLLVPLYQILEFIESSATFLSLYLLSKNTKSFIDQNPRCCKNVKFQVMRSVPSNALTIEKPFVHWLKVFISYRDNFSLLHLSYFRNLEYMELNLVSQLVGDGFSYLTKLKHLRLVRCQRMTDVVFGYVPKNLETLYISGCKWISCKGLEHHLKNLRELSILDNAHAKDENLASCDKVELLELVNCRNLTNECVVNASKNNPSLSTLRLHVNTNFTDDLFLSCTNITVLDIERLIKLQNPPLGQLTKLRKLRVSSCDHIEKCPFPSSLEEIEIKGCANLDNTCFYGLTNLRTLILTENQTLSQAMFRDLTNLEILTISECTEGIIGHVMKNLVNLKEVWLKETDIHDEIIKHWKEVEVLVLKKCPRVTGLEILKLQKLREVEIKECIGVEASVYKRLGETNVIIRESVLDIRPSVMDFMGAI